MKRQQAQSRRRTQGNGALRTNNGRQQKRAPKEPLKKDLCTVRGPKGPLTCGNTVPEVGLEPGSCLANLGSAETWGIRPGPTFVRPSPRRNACTLCTHPVARSTPCKLPTAPHTERVRFLFCACSSGTTDGLARPILWLTRPASDGLCKGRKPAQQRSTLWWQHYDRAHRLEHPIVCLCRTTAFSVQPEHVRGGQIHVALCTNSFQELDFGKRGAAEEESSGHWYRP
jgi:hypothetical protein